jgi:hypothetical protein
MKRTSSAVSSEGDTGCDEENATTVSALSKAGPRLAPHQSPVRTQPPHVATCRVKEIDVWQQILIHGAR